MLTVNIMLFALISYSLQLNPADKAFPSLLRATPPIK